MKYPSLVPRKLCKTDVTIRIEQLSEMGEPETVFEETLKCNYQNSTKTVLTADKRLVQLSGVCLFPGDIAPELPNIEGGVAVIEGQEWGIFQGIKARNPDGTVNYTEVRLE